jgi:hypothetical protein
MARFNAPAKPVPLRKPDAVTAQGGVGFTRTPKDELFVLGLANFVGDDTFYEKGKARDDRFAALVRTCAAQDPDWTRAFIGWLRAEGNMRTAPIVAAAEYVASGAPNGRQLVASVLRRPDEPGEFIGYWHAQHGRNLPMPVKRGIADALPRLYTARNILKYDGTGHAIRFGDVVEMVHPKPTSPEQSAIFKHVIDRRHGRDVADLPESLGTIGADAALLALPENERRAHLAEATAAGWSWERISGWVPGGMDAKAWEAVIPNMGLMALTRNLRNFDNLKPGLSPAAVAEIQRRFADPEEVRKSRQFPLRFLTAWKNVSSMRWGNALETALQHSLSNVPELPGRTLVLIDVSGSMFTAATTRRRDSHAAQALQPERWEVATIFGLALGQRAEKADVYLFDSTVKAQVDVAGADSILRLAQECSKYGHGGTDTYGAVATTYAGHDRVIIITDEQTGPGVTPSTWYNNGATTKWDSISHIKVPFFTWNLAGYQVGHTPVQKNWYLFGGLTDAAFKLLPILEGRGRGLWPWELRSEPQDGEED